MDVRLNFLYFKPNWAVSFYWDVQSRFSDDFSRQFIEKEIVSTYVEYNSKYTNAFPFNGPNR